MSEECPDWMRIWLEMFFADAIAVTDDKPLPIGWCVYVEPLHFD